MHLHLQMRRFTLDCTLLDHCCRLPRYVDCSNILLKIHSASHCTVFSDIGDINYWKLSQVRRWQLLYHSLSSMEEGHRWFKLPRYLLPYLFIQRTTGSLILLKRIIFDRAVLVVRSWCLAVKFDYSRCWNSCAEAR